MGLNVEVAGHAEGPGDLVAVGLVARAAAGAPEVLATSPEVGGVALPPFDPDWVRRRGFAGRRDETLVVSAAPGEPAVVLVGLGESADDPDAWRRAAAAFVRAAGHEGAAVLALPAEEARRRLAVGPAAEGAILATYRFEGRGAASGAPTRLVLWTGAGDEGRLAPLVRRAAVGAEATTWARDLANRPASSLTPRVLADLTRQRFEGLEGVRLEIWDERRIVAERLGGLMGVGRGSSEPPRLLRLRYEPPGVQSSAPLALVGKGITFDSGGLSLKTADGMTTMKTDMSGAAAVLAATWACAAERLPVTVTAWTPLAENMPGGSAIKPGDVLTIRDGSTVEVLNTDAEGRLVLADALVLAAEERPQAIVDLATLTGAAVVALGPSLAALYASSEELAAELAAAAERSGEGLWRLPLVGQYREHLDSEVADLKNIGRPGQAGSVVAALFLRHFVDAVPWAHLDIAGPARSAEATGYLTRGGTGFGTRLLLQWLRQRADAAVG